MNNVLLTFLILHMIGDFYAQSESMAKKKGNDARVLITHGLIYLGLMLLSAVYLKGSGLLLAAAVIGSMHLLIDSVKIRIARSDNLFGKDAPSKDAWIFAIDQLLYIAIIVICAMVLTRQSAVVFRGWVNDAALRLHQSARVLLMWEFLLILCAKPANIAIKACIGHYRPSVDDGTEDDRTRKAGATIGTLERLMILVLLSLGQYAAIGLVLTAKSIVRYEKISKVPQFSEYYLMGTLASMLITIVAWLSVS